MTLEELVQQVLMDVPDAPMMTVRDAVRRMARELCTEADVWVQEGEPVVVAANTANPQVTASSGQPFRIVSLTLNGRECIQGQGFDQPTPTTIEFYERPEASLVYGRLACRPAVGDMPPTEVVDRWDMAIANGARWRLLMLPQQWRNPELANYYRRQYLADVATAKQTSRLGHARGGARIKARRFI
ncbi:hypothetical protein RSO41_13355 [Halomonas sp. I1]|uniref:hypothetical protein n=1 Tax=Halomonas sp. I1 TaxID=393536 RepID=UPI0028DE0867|nr:hypothetical protein [Halomonas sp. I1]MDT8895639.1 hypothetical protein [Halomonas sp. I1]